MTGSKKPLHPTWTDPDDAPELDERWAERAYRYDGDRLTHKGRGRPPLPEGATKVAVKVRYDQDILAAFRASGPGWQTRMNRALRQFLREHDPKEMD